jgi:transmembrane sensor
MPNRERAGEIEDVATLWAAKAERGLTAGERADLDRWLEGDSRRLGAFVSAQAAWIHAERASALGEMRDSEVAEQIEDPSISQLPARGLSRRMMLGGGGAIAASAVAATFLALPRYHTLESGVGEIRHIALQGGTILMLDTDTRVDVTDASGDRRLELKRGKLFLDVARAAGAPLIIQVGGLMMETVAGAFSLESLVESPVVALVTRGQLSVSQGNGLFGRRRTVTIPQDHELMLAADANLVADAVNPITPARSQHLLAWRDGMLSFGGEALADAVRAFDRYGPVRISVADRELARQRVTGLFKADDPRGFATAIAASFGASVEAHGDVVRIFQKKNAGL